MEKEEEQSAQSRGQMMPTTEATRADVEEGARGAVEHILGTLEKTLAATGKVPVDTQPEVAENGVADGSITPEEEQSQDGVVTNGTSSPKAQDDEPVKDEAEEETQHVLQHMLDQVENNVDVDPAQAISQQQVEQLVEDVVQKVEEIVAIDSKKQSQTDLPPPVTVKIELVEAVEIELEPREEEFTPFMVEDNPHETEHVSEANVPLETEKVTEQLAPMEADPVQETNIPSKVEDPTEAEIIPEVQPVEAEKAPEVDVPLEVEKAPESDNGGVVADCVASLCDAVANVVGAGAIRPRREKIKRRPRKAQLVAPVLPFAPFLPPPLPPTQQLNYPSFPSAPLPVDLSVSKKKVQKVAPIPSVAVAPVVAPVLAEEALDLSVKRGRPAAQKPIKRLSKKALESVFRPRFPNTAQLMQMSAAKKSQTPFQVFQIDGDGRPPAATNGAKMFKCDLCGVAYQRSHSLKRHLLTMHVEQADGLMPPHAPVPAAPSAMLQAPALSCETCGTTFASRANLLKHQALHQAEEFVCLYCYRVFSSTSAREKHHQQHANNEHRHTCMFLCNNTFRTLPELRAHLRNTHNKEYFGCQRCPERFLDGARLDAHARAAHPPPEAPIISITPVIESEPPADTPAVAGGSLGHQCSQCSQSFNNFVDMCKHLRSAHGTVGKRAKPHKSQVPAKKEEVPKLPKEPMNSGPKTVVVYLESRDERPPPNELTKKPPSSAPTMALTSEVTISAVPQTMSAAPTSFQAAPLTREPPLRRFPQDKKQKPDHRLKVKLNFGKKCSKKKSKKELALDDGMQQAELPERFHESEGESQMMIEVTPDIFEEDFAPEDILPEPEEAVEALSELPAPVEKIVEKAVLVDAPVEESVLKESLEEEVPKEMYVKETVQEEASVKEVPATGPGKHKKGKKGKGPKRVTRFELVPKKEAEPLEVSPVQEETSKPEEKVPEIVSPEKEVAPEIKPMEKETVLPEPLPVPKPPPKEIATSKEPKAAFKGAAPPARPKSADPPKEARKRRSSYAKLLEDSGTRSASPFGDDGFLQLSLSTQETVRRRTAANHSGRRPKAPPGPSRRPTRSRPDSSEALANFLHGLELARPVQMQKATRGRKSNVQPILEQVKLESFLEEGFTGDWMVPKRYICHICRGRFPDFSDFEDHVMESHIGSWVSFMEVDNMTHLPDDLFVRSMEPPTEPLDPPTPLPDRASSVCTKCGVGGSASIEALHTHLLACAGDDAETTIGSPRKRRHWRPFGARRRSRRGMKRMPPSPPKNPRPRRPEGDTIQKMIANLPSKRGTRRVINFNEDEIKTRSQATIHSLRATLSQPASKTAKSVEKPAPQPTQVRRILERRASTEVNKTDKKATAPATKPLPEKVQEKIPDAPKNTKKKTACPEGSCPLCGEHFSSGKLLERHASSCCESPGQSSLRLRREVKALALSTVAEPLPEPVAKVNKAGRPPKKNGKKEARMVKKLVLRARLPPVMLQRRGNAAPRLPERKTRHSEVPSTSEKESIEAQLGHLEPKPEPPQEKPDEKIVKKKGRPPGDSKLKKMAEKNRPVPEQQPSSEKDVKIKSKKALPEPPKIQEPKAEQIKAQTEEKNAKSAMKKATGKTKKSQPELKKPREHKKGKSGLKAQFSQPAIPPKTEKPQVAQKLDNQEPTKTKPDPKKVELQQKKAIIEPKISQTDKRKSAPDQNKDPKPKKSLPEPKPVDPVEPEPLSKQKTVEVKPIPLPEMKQGKSSKKKKEQVIVKELIVESDEDELPLSQLKKNRPSDPHPQAESVQVTKLAKKEKKNIETAAEPEPYKKKSKIESPAVKRPLEAAKDDGRDETPIRKRGRRSDEKSPPSTYCQVCNCGYSTAFNYYKHLRSIKHLNNTQAADIEEDPPAEIPDELPKVASPEHKALFATQPPQPTEPEKKVEEEEEEEETAFSWNKEGSPAPCPPPPPPSPCSPGPPVALPDVARLLPAQEEEDEEEEWEQQPPPPQPKWDFDALRASVVSACAPKEAPGSPHVASKDFVDEDDEPLLGGLVSQLIGRCESPPPPVSEPIVAPVPEVAQLGCLSDIQLAMGATDEEMAMLENLGGAGPFGAFVYDSGAPDSPPPANCHLHRVDLAATSGPIEPLENADIMDLDNQQPPPQPIPPPLPPVVLTPKQPRVNLPPETEASSKLLADYEQKEMVCPVCHRHFLGLQALETHVAWAHKSKDQRGKHQDSQEGMMRDMDEDNEVARERDCLLVGLAAANVLASAGGARGGQLAAAAGAVADECAQKRRKIACFVCKELYSDMPSLNAHIRRQHVRTKAFEQGAASSEADAANGGAGNGLKRQMTTALGGLLDRALSSMLTKVPLPSVPDKGSNESDSIVKQSTTPLHINMDPPLTLTAIAKKAIQPVNTDDKGSQRDLSDELARSADAVIAKRRRGSTVASSKECQKPAAEEAPLFPENFVSPSTFDPILPEPQGSDMQCPICLGAVKHFHSLCRHLKTQHTEWVMNTFNTDLFHYLILKRDNPPITINKKYSIYVPVNRALQQPVETAPAATAEASSAEVEMEPDEAIRARAYAALQQLSTNKKSVRGSKRRPLDLPNAVSTQQLPRHAPS